MASPEQMDAFAAEARPELEQHWQNWNVYALSQWWEKWYPKTGHNRLARMLLETTGKK